MNLRVTFGQVRPGQDDLPLGRVAHGLGQPLKVKQADHGGGGSVQLVVG